VNGEERAIYWSLALIGGTATWTEVATSGEVGVRATLALLMHVLGVVALLRMWLAPARLPTARIRR
jgi:hypothetical protein